MSSGGERTKALNARMLGLVAAALVTIALLLAMPLSSLASARVEARAGGTVAIAGGDDCDVETNDGEQTTQDESTDNADQTQDESAENGDQSQDEIDSLDQSQDTSTDNSDQTAQDASTDSPGQTAQDENAENGDQSRDEIDSLDDQAAQDESTDDIDQSQDGDDNGNRAEARAGDTVAIAGGDCDAEAENVETEDNDANDFVTENDDEIEDLNGESDGETIDTSDLEELFPEEGSSDGLSANGSSDNSSEESLADEATTQDDEDSSQQGTTTQDEFSRQLSLPGSSNPSSSPSPSSGTRQGQSNFPQLSNADFTLLRSDEKDEISKIRRFDPNPDALMSMSIRALGLYGVPVINSNNEKALNQGVMHVPDTANPWDREDQKNVFIAGHRLGSPREDSRLIFYQLDELEPGDEIVLKDRRGRAYKYRVRKLFKVAPDDAWVADTLVGRDLLTLQTYTLPNFEDRLVVRADRVQSNSGQQRNRR